MWGLLLLLLVVLGVGWVIALAVSRERRHTGTIDVRNARHSSTGHPQIRR